MFKLALAFVSLVFLTANPALAAPSPQSNWVVTQLTGDARVVHPGAQPASLKVNNRLAPGDTLMTGPTGRATLVRGGDYIIVAPRSELRLPSTPQPSGFTRVIQNLGTLLFKVQHTGIPHFAVDTPMLAAVVKGTTFTVVVDGQRSAVQVLQGVVQVSAIDGGMSRMVEGGRTVFVNHDRPRMLLDADRPAAPIKAPSSTSVSVSASGESPLSAIAALTGGLVRADLSAPQSVVAAAIPVVNAGSSPSPSSPVPVATNAPAVTAATAPTASAPAADTTVISAPVTVIATAAPVVSAPTATVPSATTPTATVPIVTTSTVTVPSISIGSNSGPGSMNSGSGSLNSGPGSIGSGSSSTPTATIAPVTTPTVTVPTLTTPTITTPLVTVPSISTPTVTVPTVTTPTVTAPTVTTILAPITNLLKL